MYTNSAVAADTSAYSRLPPEVLQLICQASSRQVLNSLQHVSRVWRLLSLPLLWRCVEISSWEDQSSAHRVNAVYGHYVYEIEYRRYRRRRGNSHNTSNQTQPSAAVDGKTKTQVLCEWLDLRWENLRKVAIGSWPPYNISRVQDVLAERYPKLRVLVLEGAATAWVDTLRRAVTAHPYLQGLHITEDNRALLPAAADGHYKKPQIDFSFLTSHGNVSLTQLTVPCIVESVCQLLAHLPTLLPQLHLLDLRQLDAGAAGRILINLPSSLRHLKISGQHPLNMRMFGSNLEHCTTTTASAYMAEKLTLLSVTGFRSEEAARRESEQFWVPLLQHQWPKLTKLVVSVARPELGLLISKGCPKLEYLRFVSAGSAIYRHQNDQWAAYLTRLSNLRHLDIASSNNEYEGCSLSPHLATGFTWTTPWLQSLYVSRLTLSTSALESLLTMLPHLHTLWFTFDMDLPEHQIKAGLVECNTPRLLLRKIRYLIIHDICSRSSDRSIVSSPEDDIGINNAAMALSVCLARLPSVNRCRLPMFTFPDDQRCWLQQKFPQIDFKKYAPPY